MLLAATVDYRVLDCFREWKWEGKMFKAQRKSTGKLDGGGRWQLSTSKKLEYHPQVCTIDAFRIGGWPIRLHQHWNGMENKEAFISLTNTVTTFVARGLSTARLSATRSGKRRGYQSQARRLQCQDGADEDYHRTNGELVKGERNHPSIQIWALDNEYMFINVENLAAPISMSHISRGWAGCFESRSDASQHG
jgi:hypothetical protein